MVQFCPLVQRGSLLNAAIVDMLTNVFWLDKNIKAVLDYFQMNEVLSNVTC